MMSSWRHFVLVISPVPDPLRRRVQKNLHARVSTCPIKTLAIDFREGKSPHTFSTRTNVNNSKKYKMPTQVRCRIYKGLCPPSKRNVLFNAEGDYTVHQSDSFFKAYSLSTRRDKPGLDYLAVAAEIAEIMQIEP
jgi:hypothetical protein